MGLDFSKRWIVVEGVLFVKIPDANVMRVGFSCWLESWFWCRGSLGKKVSVGLGGRC